MNGGSCQALEGNYTCTCSEGFDGAHCEHNIDDCLRNPCENGGTCYDGLNDYNCNCTSKFMGKNCDQPYDPCIKHGGQCKNGGQCQRKVLTSGSPLPSQDGTHSDFYCECKFGFSGALCQNNINDCDGIECPQGKTCIDGIGRYDCQDPIDVVDCASNPCQNNGQCLETNNGYR